ncbi:hypothetical protein HBI56_201650 [Parastagonospora nodorum]|uniref:Uncharacterized protein n=1 Tax=Phaeosphaeria nodorum (strain SN15 / ATCC MYA-4574 / FGSC 10173) TaxID=321614 RepID=A0A7U2HX59_PHANO|nr:hypothetical protein HBH56_216180 [Parastagonospora nodorum]QRC93913.1 hypothetical protein JI435_404760 [Parastagonospora nodorum SN15]KAH3922551.1 hypothetical protein HBH54_221330 [Parastagonospora nodorum]KAH3942063.1 hypothetical protein HBH53_191240 [Parastagonospora nodorum]KAH3961293.1 hypothetical protein HBH51_184860 [Parastagonospora nodorum]
MGLTAHSKDFVMGVQHLAGRFVLDDIGLEAPSCRSPSRIANTRTIAAPLTQGSKERD